MLFIVFFLLYILPLVFIPFVPLSLEIPKVIIAEIGISVVFFYQRILGQVKSKTSLKLLFPLAGIFLLTIFHLVVLKTESSFFGNFYRLQGVFLLWHLLALVIVAANFDENYIHPRFSVSMLTILIVLGWIMGGDENGRAFGTLGEPNALAATAIFLGPISLFHTKQKHSLILKVLLIVFLVFMTGSRSGLIALGLQLFFLFIVYFFKQGQKVSLIICGVLLILAVSLPLVENKNVLENRAEIWRTAWIAGLKNPLLGGGFGNTEQLLRDASWQMSNNVRFQKIDSAHNLFLDWWVQGGLVGVGLLVFLVIGAFRLLLVKNKTLEIVILLGLLTVQQFNPASVVTLVAFWWVIGRGFVQEKK